MLAGMAIIVPVRDAHIPSSDTGYVAGSMRSESNHFQVSMFPDWLPKSFNTNNYLQYIVRSFLPYIVHKFLHQKFWKTSSSWKFEICTSLQFKQKLISCLPTSEIYTWIFGVITLRIFKKLSSKFSSDFSFCVAMYSGEDILWWWPLSGSTPAKALQRYQSLEPIWYRFLGESVTGLAF